MDKQSRTAWVAYADGSCLGNPGPGGWGVVLIDPDGVTTELSGTDSPTTNNRMEITAAIEALRRIPAGALVILHSDSQYLVKTMNLGWKRRENLDLWARLDEEAIKRRVQWEWVRGHSGDPLNQRADELARSAAEKRPARPAYTSRAPARSSAPETESVEARLAPLLTPDEQIRRCANCGAAFVAGADSRYCSRAECQLKARTPISH
jgi:ribonuclease HI